MTVNDKGIETDGNKPVVEDAKLGEKRGTEPKKVEIEVNGKKVEMLEGPTLGLEIKREAINKGVSIKESFVLQQEMPNGTGKVIGDNDKVFIREHLSFTVIEPDDNS